MNIGQKIQIGLKKKGIRQKDLAQQMGVASNTVSQWITGHSIPPGDKLIQVAQILEIQNDLFPPSNECVAEKIEEYNVKKEVRRIEEEEKMLEMRIDSLADAVEKIAKHVNLQIHIRNDKHGTVNFTGNHFSGKKE